MCVSQQTIPESGGHTHIASNPDAAGNDGIGYSQAGHSANTTGREVTEDAVGELLHGLLMTIQVPKGRLVCLELHLQKELSPLRKEVSSDLGYNTGAVLGKPDAVGRDYLVEN